MALLAYRLSIISFNPYSRLNFSSCCMYIYCNITGNHLYWWVTRCFWRKKFIERVWTENHQSCFSRVFQKGRQKEDIYTRTSIIPVWFDHQALRSCIATAAISSTCQVKFQNQSRIFRVKTCLPLKIEKPHVSEKYFRAYFCLRFRAMPAITKLFRITFLWHCLLCCTRLF